jgi:hypothetical protein
MKKITLLFLFLFLVSCAPVRAAVVTPTPVATSTAVVPVTASGLPKFDHIILIVLENKDYSVAMDRKSMPELNVLAQKYVLLSNDHGVSHPSLPNYLALMSGSTQGVTSDCTNCFVNAANLADEIANSGRTWKAYLESMPSPCFIGDAKPYAQKHNPLLYFDSIRLNASVCDQSIVPLTQLDSDLSANQLPNFAYIMPNLCNSGHDCSAGTADKWLGSMVTKLQASPALGQNSLIAITFDEASDSDTSSCCGLGQGGGHVVTVLISPSAKPGFTDDTPYSHYSLLKTILTAWNLPDLGITNQPTIKPIVAPWSVSINSGSTPIPVTTDTPSSSSSAPTQVDIQSMVCSSSSPASNTYTVKICFSNPNNESTLTGEVEISASFEITGTQPGVQRAVFYLDGNYLLTSYYSPYKFTLPTEKWVDGNHTLSVEALMRDQFVTQRANLAVVFKNGVTSVPVNNNVFQPSTGRTPSNGEPFIVAAVGDGAGGGQDETKVTDLIASINPNLFLYLGDVYQEGSPAEFYNWYGTSSTFYGQFRAITNPTIGNHDYLTGNASAYFDYWNNIPDYYSYDTNGWHFISLNSNGSKVPTGAGSEQYNWLEQDLAKNTLPCTIVYYHHPLFNVGTEGPTPQMADIWKLLAQYKVSIVLNGHDHDYQRWMPLDGNGQPSPDGITEFVVGTGGHGLQSFPQSDDRVAYSNNSNPEAFGILTLQLNKSGANFSFLSTDESVLDSGVIPCRGANADEQSPTMPTKLTAAAVSSTRVDLTWGAAQDNTGVAGYAIYRNGLNIATVPAYRLEYSDTTVTPALNYAYSMVAFDSEGRKSLATLPVKVVTPGVATDITFSPVADLYVNSANPGSNYGKSPFMKISSNPEMNAYMRFTVTGLKGKSIAHAYLLIYANNSNKQGFSVAMVESTIWGEESTSFKTAPSVGDVLADSGAISADSWITLDLTEVVTGEGTYDFSITANGDKSISLASRESGVNAPQLVIDFK